MQAQDQTTIRTELTKCINTLLDKEKREKLLHSKPFQANNKNRNRPSNRLKKVYGKSMKEMRLTRLIDKTGKEVWAMHKICQW